MMNLVTLSDEDFDEVEVRFTQFHEGYTSFFQNRTKSGHVSEISLQCRLGFQMSDVGLKIP
ncbi:hypothetical protein HYR99_34735 [Candidatus Poribacteria bacterium]|nr:hypothetical protein [Candidatus Poribacteria bacterium]